MEQSVRRANFLVWAWTLFVLVVVYLPIACGALAGLSKSRYFGFPVAAWSTDWWTRAMASIEVKTIVETSLAVAGVVTLVSVVVAFFGALAFARYDWKGRRLYQKLVLLPIFFPQPVLGLALLLWFNAVGVQPSWTTAIFAHLVWIVPVVTLVIAIRVYGFDPALEEAAADLGASRLFILREVTLPILWPGVWSGALFAFLLSWGNFPLSLYTTGADSTVPEWLYAKMVAGYTPMVPAIGTMSTLAAASVLLVGGAIALLLRRRAALNAAPAEG
ncbi:spermidine/putrescine ABC transporter permease [Methylopila jiangsuensis]|uniref:Spermidine/putrescine ABC transporter permease n=1 Tax=Methylopila jiangsuensis TaxID=586230 RepID=A0A9W6JLN3_9HYPH|nr:ABC transporter permease [Methylopila jiangsuensis]MDR6284826.1 spermidine/putrescine transport system permease protein [Methylopila jiangsuensis]GLK77783.1 spermidine/putrescine ABC transporter permease [Methylopila jiangsuensis]